MRAALLLVVAAACRVYDPIDVPYREFPDTASAIQAILAEVPIPQVYAVGEYHATRAMPAHSSMSHFTDEIIGLLEPHAHHLVIETWQDACASHDVGKQIAQATQRPVAMQAELMRLFAHGKGMQLETHGLPMTCLEHQSLRDPTGRVDFLRLLETVTEKLAETTRALVGERRGVIVYGGALHNDLYPRWPFDELSYAVPLAKELGGQVLELDLVVPEVVAPMPLVRREAWFPLLGLAAPGRVIVWERGPNSYVVILPAQSDEVAKLARPIETI